MTDSHPHWMDQALALAELGRGWTSPNPIVGAIVVKDGVAVGRGWHREFGGPHAEVFALKEAGAAARGARLYCTLEPCSHFGKTPPCTLAVIDAGIKTVILGARDPHPQAAGGAASLRAAGLEVIENIRADECRRSNAPFFKFTATGLPFVALKWAMSLDGKISANSGDSKWISGERSRAYVHQLRAGADAVAVGSGTVKADDPALSVRPEKLFMSDEHLSMQFRIKQPARIIFDTHAATALNGNLWRAQPAGTLIFVTAASENSRERVKALRDNGAVVLEMPVGSSGRPAIEAVLRELARHGMTSVLVEGGAELLGSFLDAKMADRVHVFIAPKIVGGLQSKSAVAGRGTERMSDALILKPNALKVRRFDEDVLIEGALSDWAL